MKIEEEIKQTQFKSANQKAMINLLFTSNWLISTQQHLFKPFGITAQQYNILRILKGQHPQMISATELKSRMLDKNSDVSRLLDRLIAKKLVDKKICPSDRRAADVFITEPGLQLLQVIQQTLDEDNVLSLTAEEASQLSDLLDKCRG
jgi:DNA-binding MarR family transcriptional regulator